MAKQRSFHKRMPSFVASAVAAFVALVACSFLRKRAGAFSYSDLSSTRTRMPYQDYRHCQHHLPTSRTKRSKTPALFLLRADNTGEGSFGKTGEASNRKKDGEAASSSSLSPLSSPPLAASTSNTTVPPTSSPPINAQDDIKYITSTSSTDFSDIETLHEVQVLQQRAQELRTEARVMEEALNNTKSNATQQRQVSSKYFLNRLFHANRPRTPQAVARVLREERWSVDQAILVLQLLYEQQRAALGADPATVKQQQGTSSIVVHGVNPDNAASASAATPTTGNQTQLELLESNVQCLLDAAALLDQETLQATTTTTGTSNTTMFLLNSRERQRQLSSNRNSRWSGRGAPVLRSQWKAWQRSDEKEAKRQVAATIQAALSKNNGNASASVEDYIRRTLGLHQSNFNSSNKGWNEKVNVTRGVERISLVPLWLPSPLIKFMVASGALLESADVKAIKDRVLPASRFYCTTVDTIPSAALFRGNIRDNININRNKPFYVVDKDKDEEEEEDMQTPLTVAVFAEIQELMDREQLSSRVQLLFMPDPQWRPHQDERELTPKPVLLAIPTAVVPDESLLEQEQSVARSVGKKVAIGMALLTTLTYSLSCYALNPKFFDSIVNQQDVATVTAALPVFFGVCAVSAIHEIAHRLVARKHGMKIGWPIPLPSTQFGTFGCISPLRSFPPNRAALLDFALSGPVASLVVSVLLMVFGIRRTVHAAPMALQRFPVVCTALLKSSFLTSSLLTLLAPKVMMLPLSQPIPIHPCFMVGFSGMMMSALNLLPIFRLDGGRACSAAMGPRFGGIASASTVLFLLSAALSGTSSVAWAFGVLILFFQRRPEIPVRDDATEVDDFRLGTWVASLLTSVLALAPFPGGPGLL